MRLNSLAMLGFCLFCTATSWAQEPTEDTQNATPDDAETSTSSERPLLPERSVRWSAIEIASACVIRKP